MKLLKITKPSKTLKLQYEGLFYKGDWCPEVYEIYSWGDISFYKGQGNQWYATASNVKQYQMEVIND